MAFVSGNSPDQGANTDQDPNKTALADQAPMTSAPAGGGGTGKPSGQASSTGPSQPFTNLSAYLTANGPQVQQMGADIAGQLGTDYNTTNNAITAAKDSYGTDVAGGYTPFDQSLIDSFNTNPSAVASDPTKAASFKGMYNDRYTGPGNFQDSPEYADLSGKVQKSKAFSDQVSTMPGLESYLSAKSPTYTQGQATLDSSLLRTNPEAVKSISDAAAPFAGLPGYLDQTVTAQNAAVAAANAQAQQAKNATRTAVTNASGALSTGVNDAVAKANADRLAYNKAVQSNMPVAQDARAALLSAQQAASAKYASNVHNMAGNDVTADQMMQKIAQMIDPASYLSKLDPFLKDSSVVNAPGAADVATSDQYARDAALEQLLGPDYNNLLDPANASKAGTYHTPDMPGAMPDTGGEKQYIGDISNLYGEAYGMQNANTPGGWQNATPQQIAQAVLAASKNQGQGVNPSADTIAALQRLAANSYSGR